MQLIKKKIAIIIPSLNGGGAEKVCITLTKSLSELGHEIKLLVLSNKSHYDLPDDFPVSFLSEKTDVKLSSPRIRKELAKKLKYEFGEYDAYISNLDYSHQVLNEADLPNTFYVIHNSLRQTLKREKLLGPIKYYKKRNSYKVLNNKDVITVSDGLLNEIRNSNIVKVRSSRRIYNPIDIQHIEALSRVELATAPKDGYILYVGRVAKQKRVDLLIKSYIESTTTLPLVLLCGDSSKINKYLKKLPAGKSIITVDFTQNPYAWMRSASLLVLTSDYEGFGMVLVEALACGTPVVSTNCEHGPSEIMTGKMSKYLTPVGDHRLLAKKIDYALLHKSDFITVPILDKLDIETISYEYLNTIFDS